MLQIGEVLWIIATHTLYIVVLVILVAMVDHLLGRLGMAERSVPIPFFPHAVPLEDALTLLDLCIIVLLYLIALKEIAELYGLFGEEEEGS